MIRRPALAAIRATACVLAAVAAAQDPAPAPSAATPTAPAAQSQETAAHQQAIADQVLREVEALYGSPSTRPVPIRVVGEPALADFVARKVDLDLRGGKLERMNAWLHCMGLLKPEQDFRTEAMELIGGLALGLYDSADKVMLVRENDAGVGDWNVRFAIAHELGHALDDMYVDLEKMMLPEGRDLTKDEMFAYGAITEGSAIDLSIAWAMKNPRPADEKPSPAAMAMMQRVNLAFAKTPAYCTLATGKHTIGRAFYAVAEKARPVADRKGPLIHDLARRMPASTEQVLHPQKYFDEAQRDDPVVLANAADLRTDLKARCGLPVLGTETLGEMVAAVIASARQPIDIARRNRPEQWTNTAAIGWGGDCLFLLGTAGGTAGVAVADPGVLWITAWDTVSDREEFVTAMREHATEPGFAMKIAGRTVAFAFGSARPLTDADLAALLAACRFTKGDAAWTAIPG